MEQTLESACPLDCPDACSLSVTVDDGRVTRIDGSERNVLTRGLICGKVRKFDRHMYGAERLRHPMRRVGPKGSGAFERISWDDAMVQLCTEIDRVRQKSGGEAIVPFSYGGSNGYLTDGTVDARLFRRLGASRLLYTFCAVPTSKASSGLYGSMPGVSPVDYVHAQLIVVWGINPSATSIHLVPFIQQARARGARLVVVDPRAIPLARQADLHIAPRPGTDGPVALALINWLFEQGRADIDFLEAHTRDWQTLRERAQPWTLEAAAEVAGVAVADLRQFATWYADAEPAVIRMGNGLERNRNGGSAASSVLALPAVGGKFGVRGGGFTLFSGRAWGIDTEPAIAEPEPETREINQTRLARALAELNDPPIELLFVYNCNPVASAPRQTDLCQQLMREDLFTVVYEQVHNDTADYADLLLPATTFLEHRELRKSYGSPHLFDSPAVATPVGESRPNYQVFAELCERLGLARPDDPVQPQQLIDAIIEPSPHRDSLRAQLAERGVADYPDGVAPILFHDVWPDTPERKVQLLPESLESQAPLGLYGYRPDPGTDAHPIALISPALSRMVTSTFGQLLSGQVPVDIHPDDARARGIASGDTVRVFNDLGEFRCLARVSDVVRPGVAQLPKGLWKRHTKSGTTSNAVIPDDEGDVGRAACFNDARVQIERV